MLKQEEAFARQHAFRIVLNCLAHPGVIGNISADVMRDSGPAEALMLETLAVASDRVFVSPSVPAADSIMQRISAGSGSGPGKIADAAFVVVPGDELSHALPSLRRGVLEYPDEGATVIAQVASIGEQGEGSCAEFRLRGPGISGETCLKVWGIGPDTPDVLAAVNSRFPLGVDLILLDKQGRVAGIPRSAQPATERYGVE